MSDIGDARPLQIGGPQLPQDARLHEFRGRERLGRAFNFKVLFSSARSDLSPDTVLGSPVTIKLKDRHGDRIFAGIVARFSFLGVGGLTKDAVPARTRYRVVIRPRLWRLTWSSHSRFFYDKSVLDIVKLLLDEQEVDYRVACTANYPKRDNCTQYRETDFDFLNRLLQREGIYYYFEYTAHGDRLVLVDDPQQHAPISGDADVPYNPVLDENGIPFGDVVYRWKSHRRIVPGKSETNAFDFLNVARSTSQGLLARATSPQQETPSYVIEEPGLWYVDEADGRRYAQGRLDSWLGRAAPVAGRSSAARMCTGGVFRLGGHPYKDPDGEYLVTEMKYRMSAGDPIAGSRVRAVASAPAGAAERTVPGAFAGIPARKRRKNSLFDCTFRAIPKGCRFRGSCWAPVPTIGPQTAVVVAASGDDFATDAHGRIKVQFHWEQFNPPGASQRMQRCWVRVAQAWAGKGWGAMFLPREGQEVLVDFLNGDPDVPVVVGGLYNSSNKPPYTLPGAGAVSTIRTRGTGTQDGERNELRFNDEKLQVLLYTDGRYDNYVKGSGLAWIGKDAHTIVKERQLVEAGSQHITVQGDHRIKVGQSISVQAGQSLTQKVDENYVVEGLVAHIKALEKVVIEANAQISLKVGASFVTVTPEGVQISGPMVMLNSGGAAGTGPGGSPASPEQPEQADDGSSVK
ncbi:type VI secretion system Vgr family protein [Bordetella flabilis]|uniref:type VI secretion system Vgr family protein n=1 Tax=Bordetella flabilis TaxID=463014 RepID=UPI000A05798C|nr:type VI secretion system tip protein TssI/VgrG [Bordetella flabilis]